MLTCDFQQGYWYSGMEYNMRNKTKSELNPFFYGVTLEHELKSQTYQADALSANTGLNATHYKEQHTYRFEWEPPEEDGSGGHIRWYTDKEFVYSVKGADLSPMSSEIPSEAMYLIMNTAVASSWGFPAPCPDGCDCSCFECDNPKCACALPEGYCDNFPATFEIDYVRVYQAKNESKHSLGCSPVKKPTELYIKGHEKRYMEKGDKHPIMPIVSGGAYCSEDSDCEGFSSCQDGVCACDDGYTGPTCLAHTGFYINEDRAVTTTEIGCKLPFPIVLYPLYTQNSLLKLFVSTGSKIWIPNALVGLVMVLVAGFVFAMIQAVRAKKSRHLYKKVETTEVLENDGSQSYQHSESPKPKVVTYSVIDGNLVDK